MKSYLVVTLTCPDRPGIVDQVTKVISKFGANWEESRMAHLGGEFAGIVNISVPAEHVEPLKEALLALQDHEMRVVVKDTQVVVQEPQANHTLYELTLTGADHEGIVHSVSHYLAGQGINVEAMETKVVPAPISATPLFQMQSRIKTPSQLGLDELKNNLDELADDLGVDIDIRSIVP